MKKNLFWRLLMLLALLAVTPGLSQGDPLDNWHWKNPLPQGNALRTVTYGVISPSNKRFVAVGDYGTILTSTDGSNWNNRSALNAGSSGTRNNLRGVAFGNLSGSGVTAPGFIATGDNGSIIKSSDGVAWAVDQSAGITENLAAIAYGVDASSKQAFVAVGANGVVVRTLEGTTWKVSYPSAMAGQSLNGIAYGNAAFVAISNSGNIFYSSDNGATWSRSPDSNSSSPLNGISFVNGNFVAVGTSGTLLASSDGVNWTVQSSGTSADLYGVAYGSNNGTYLVVGSGSSIINSTGLVSWNAALNPPASNYNLYSVAQDDNNTYVAVGDFGEILLYKPSAVTWTEVQPAPATTAVAIKPVWPGDTVYAAAGAGALYRSYSDGGILTWSPAQAGLPGLDLTSLAIDPAAPSHLYAGTAAGAGGGLYLSIDDATNWYRAPITAPLDVKATALNSQVTLSWQPVPGAVSYKVYWSTSPGFARASATVVDNVTSPWVHGARTNGTTYYYLVTASTPIQESVSSSTVSATPSAQVVSVPSGVLVKAGNGSNVVDWSAVPGAASYNVYWSATPGVTRSNGTKVAGAAAPYTDPAPNGSIRYYVVTAVSGGVESAESVQVSGTPQNAAADVPRQPGVTAQDAKNTIVWSAPAAGADSYNLYWDTVPGVSKASPNKVAGATSGYSHSPVANGSLYYYVVTAVKGGVEGAESAQVAGAPGAQTVGVPYGVGASAGDQKVSVSWAPTAGAASYNLYWSTSPGVTKSTGTKVPNVSSPYEQTDLANGTTYYYVVTAVSGGVESANSSQVSAVPNAPGIQFSQINTITIDPADHTHILVGTDSGLFASKDQGLSWSEIKFSPLISFNNVNAIALDPSNSKTIYVGTGWDANLSKSTDGGDTWSRVRLAFADQTVGSFNEVKAIAVDPLTPATVYVGTVTGAYKTTNAGSIWAATNPGLGRFPVNSIVLNQTTPSTLYMGTDIGVYLSYNSGTDWAVFNTGLQSSAKTSSLAINPWFPGIVFAGTENGVHRITNTSFLWASQRHDVVYSSTSMISRSLQAIASGNNALVAVGGLDTIFTVNDGVKRAGSGDFTGIAFGNNKFVAVGPTASEQSTDNGVNWGLTATSPANAVAFGNGAFVTATGAYHGLAFGNNTFVRVGLGGAIQTSIDGDVWTARTSPTSNMLKGVAFGDDVFVAVGAFGTILKSTDNGASWQIITQPASIDLNGVAFANGHFVAVGLDSLHGIILTSSDGGSVWIPRPSGSVNALNGVAFGNNKFYAVGGEGTVIFSDPIPSPAATVTATTPANGATGVPVDTPVTATFSADMIPSSFVTSADGSAGSFTISPPVSGASVSFDSANFRATLSHTGDFAYSTSYRVVLATAVRDAAGNALPAQYLWQFTTEARPDTTPPQVSQSSPGTSLAPAADVPVTATIQVTFSKSVDPATVSSSTFKVTDASNLNVSGAVTYNGLTATFTPAATLLKGTSYTVTVTNGIKDMSGNALPAPYTWSFTTIAAYTVTVSSVGSGSITPATTILDKGSSQSFSVSPGTGFSLDDLKLDGVSVRNQMAGSVYTLSNITSNHTLIASFKKTYQITTSVGANGAVTVYSKSGAGADQFSNLSLDGVTALNSDNGQLYWKLAGPSGNRSFSLYKNTAGDAASLVAQGSAAADGTITLSSANVSGIRGSVDVSYQADSTDTRSNILQVAIVTAATSPLTVTVDSAATRYLTFTPAGGYVVGSVSDNGAALPQPLPTSYLFSNISEDHQVGVGFAVDVTPPTITAVTPLSGATNVSPASVITATFSKAMKAASITGASFIVKDAGGNSIPGTVGYSGLVATFTPSLPLALNTEHTVTVTTAVQDLYANQMVSPYVWKFTAAKDVQYLTVIPAANGSITPSGLVPVPKGSPQTFTITTDPNSYNKVGSALLDITVDGTSVGANKLPQRNPVTGSYSYTTDPVQADHVLGVIFTSATHTLTVQSKVFGIVTNGSVYVGYDLGTSGQPIDSTTTLVQHGANSAWTIIPDVGYYLTSITYNGVLQNIPPVNPDGSYSYLTPTIIADATLLCTFTSISDPGNSNSTLTVQAGAGGSFSYGATTLVGGANADGSYKSVTLAAIPNSQLTLRITTLPGYALAGLLMNGLPVPDAKFPTRNADGSYRFTTDPLTAASVLTATFSVDTTKPVVVGTVPADGASGVAILQPVIAATFSKQINPATITTVNFVVKEKATGNPVPGTLGFDSSSQRATFMPTMPLSLATVYSVNLTSGITDVYGNPLSDTVARPTSFTFTTRNDSHDVTVKYGPNGKDSAYTFTVNVKDNENLSLTIAPSASGDHPWYRLGEIKVDGVAVSLPVQNSDGRYYFTLNNVIKDCTVEVNFTQLTHTITATAGGNGSVTGSAALNGAGKAVVNDADSITLTLTPSSGFGLSSLSDNGTPLNLAVPQPGLTRNGSPNSDGTYSWLYTISAVTADHVISAGFANSYRITVSAGSGGSITPGSTTVGYGSDKSFTITADTGYRITGVSVNGIKVDGFGETSFSYTFANVTTDQNLSATFSPYQNHIDVLPSASGTIFPSGVIYRNPGTASTFAITPAIGYSLTSILLDGVTQPLPTTQETDGSYKYVVAASEKSSTLAAGFTLKTFTATMTTGVNGSLSCGSIVAAPTDNVKKVTIAYGGAATFRVIPASGYYLKDIRVDDTSVLGQLVNDSITLQNVTADHTVEAVFDIKYRITASAGPNGTISPPGTVLYNTGDKPPYLFAPATGYQVQSVKVDGVPLDPVPQESYTFPGITKDKTIEVAFVLKTFTVKMADAVQHGSMHPSSVTLSYGGSQSFTLVPDQGYRLKDVKIGDTSVFPNVQSNILTLNKVTADQTITPAFEPVVFAITLQAGAGGRIGGNTEVSYDQDATFTITPDANYHVLDVKVDGVSVWSQMNGSTSYTLANVRGVHTVSATFAINTFVIRANAGNGGSITPAGSTTLNYGSNQLYTVTPADGYMLDDVKLDNVSVKSSLLDGTFTVSGIAADHAIAATFTPLVYPDGDLNGDGKITVEDALIALQMAVGIRVPTRDDIAHGDVAPLTATGKPKPNAKIDVADALVLLQRTVGNIKAW